MISIHFAGGNIHASTAAIGIWDPIEPFTDHVVRSIQAMCQDGKDLSCFAVIVLWPRPNFYYGDILLFHHLKSRLNYFMSQGLSVFVCHLDKPGVLAGSIEFFDALVKHTSIRRLILGPHQTLGPAERGNPTAIRMASSLFGIKVNRMPAIDKEKISLRLLIEASLSGDYELLKNGYRVSPPTRILMARKFRETFLQDDQYLCRVEDNDRQKVVHLYVELPLFDRTLGYGVWARMNSRGERILSPECGWLSL
jgi:hypothetical protein